MVMCDASWTRHLEGARRLVTGGGSKFHVHETRANATGVQACMRKIEVFDWKGIAECAAALYLDCDVVVTGDVVARILRPTAAETGAQQGQLRVRTERYPHTNGWFSLPGGYTPEQCASMDADGVRPFNCGQFAFAPLADGMQERFAAVRRLVKGHVGEHFYEQSFMNHLFNLQRATDNGALLDAQVVLFARTLLAGATLHHVCDASLSRDFKLATMRAILGGFENI
jgi:hypothetical protein